jgi:hypothetical protein
MPWKVIRSFWTGSRIIRADMLLEEEPDEAFADCVAEVIPEDALGEVPEAELAEEPEPERQPIPKTWQSEPRPKPKLKPVAPAQSLKSARAEGVIPLRERLPLRKKGAK